jgi:hypothetical protein
VLLDLLHFGWPDHVDVFSDSFSSNLQTLRSNSRLTYGSGVITSVSSRR